MFSINKNVNATQVVFEVSGRIDEDADFAVPGSEDLNTVVIDFGGIEALNSIGCRSLHMWLKSFELKMLILRRCPSVLIDQINMMSGFIPKNTIIESFFVAYYSPSTAAEVQLLFRNGIEFYNGRISLPTEPVGPNGEALEIDVMEAKYFKFLKNHPGNLSEVS